MPQPQNKVASNFVGGEISDLLNSRIDLPLYAKSLRHCENFIILPQGGARYRGGAQFIKNTRLNKPAWFIPFNFSDQQSYLIEATDLKFRFYSDQGIILNTAKTITGVSNASPGVITSASHGFSNGDEVFIKGIVGPYELNSRFYLVANSATNTFTLTEIDGAPVSTLNLSTYTGGGTAAKVYEIASPFAEADLPTLQWAQSADTMYFAHRNYKPRKLVRTNNTSWAVSTPTLTADPFGADGSGNCPGAVTFIDSSRLMYAGTSNAPETLWASKAPTTGVSSFENFTTGTNDADAFIFTLASIHGRVDAIQWVSSTNKIIVLGCFGSIRTLYGATFTTPISPTSLTAKSINTLGAARITPVTNGDSLYYVQRGSELMRSFEYDFTADQYVTSNKNLVSTHLTDGTTYAQIVEQQTKHYDAVWALRADGTYLGLTYHQDENISGWHRHYVAGQFRDSATKSLYSRAKVLNVGVLPRTTGGDQLWLIVEREINNKTVRSVELIADQPAFPRQVEFYSGSTNEARDRSRYFSALWEKQKLACHLDMSVTYNGAAEGNTQTISLIPSATTGNNALMRSVVITGTLLAPIITATDYFTADMVGREIWKAYDGEGNGGGRARITSYIDAQNVIVEIIQDFDNTDPLQPGMWHLSTRRVSGLNHLEGQIVQVVADGGVHPDCQVQNGAVNLNYAASVVHAGLSYTGRIKTQNQDQGGITGVAEAKTRCVYRCMIDLLHTIGLKFGTDEYRLEQIDLRNTIDDRLDRAPALQCTTARVDIQDTPSEIEKCLSFVQDLPLPCTFLGYDLFTRTTDEGA